MFALLLICLYLAALLLAARRIGLRVDPQARGAERLLLTGSALLGLAVALPTVLGAAGLLRGPVLLGTALALGAATLVRRGALAELGEGLRSLRALEWPRSPLFRVSAAVAALMCLWALLAAQTPSLGWDDYFYHLPFMVHAFQTGDLGPFPVADNVDYINAYPKSLELIGTTFVILSGSMQWVELVQLLFLPGACLAIYVLSRRLGADRELAAPLAFVPFQIPMVMCQLKTAYIDVANASLVCMVFAGLFLAARGGRAGLFICVVMGGVLAGCKPTGPYLGATLPSVATALYCWRQKLSRGAIVRLAAVVGLALLLLGGHWFVRNIFLYGNPLWPFILDVGPLHLPGRFSPALVATWQGPPSTLTPLQRWLFAWLEARTWFGPLYNFDTNFAGFGPLWLMLLLPSLLTAGVLAAVDSSRARRLTPLAWFVLLAVGLHVMDPGRQYGRYSMHVPMLAAVALGALLGRLPRVAHTTVAALWLAGLAWCVFGTASFGYLSPQEARQLATLRTPTSRPWFHGAFLGELPSRLRDEDVLLYTEDVSFVAALWKPDLGNRILGHSLLKESLQQAVRRLKPTVVLGKRATLDRELAGLATETLFREETDDGLELRKILH
ncbi:hypothetical protein JRI60_20960 [Archangium violaceum]|uniref:hypothetical protein n=1 Tax=Archangium violaceum TaxID=83451 RepID=UPI00194E7DE6|nr:hypothetical protein [Archangium violaceum]QRO01315.1 hypothetical protein JRI60_20960 [Archangium violaceum]